MSILPHLRGTGGIELLGLLALMLLLAAAVGARAWFAADRLTTWPPQPESPAAEIQDIQE